MNDKFGHNKPLTEKNQEIFEKIPPERLWNLRECFFAIANNWGIWQWRCKEINKALKLFMIIRLEKQDDNSCVFLSWSGETLRFSQVNKAMKSIWKKAKVVGAPSSTLIRKSAVSGVHSVSESSGSHSDLADLMAHNVGTARRFYRLQGESKSSARASKQLRSIMRGEKQQTDDDDTEAQSVIGEDCHFKTTEGTSNAEKGL